MSFKNTEKSASLEYNSSIWSPTTITNIRAIESIQKRYTKSVCKRLNLKFNSYKDRLKIFNLESLEYRRVKCDLILVYKILNNLIDIEPNTLFKRSNFYSSHNLRRHNQCLTSITNPKSSPRNNFFSLRILSIWNSLPVNVIQSASLNLFKFRLGKLNLYEYHNFTF